MFISSIMNPDREDLRPEREAAKAAIERFSPISTAWAFEHATVSSQPLLDFYLEAVKACDLLILIVGEEMTEPVRQEFITARDHGKPILVFRKSVSQRTPEAEAILREADKKYDDFADAAELARKIAIRSGPNSWRSFAEARPRGRCRIHRSPS